MWRLVSVLASACDVHGEMGLLHPKCAAYELILSQEKVVTVLVIPSSFVCVLTRPSYPRSLSLSFYLSPSVSLTPSETVCYLRIIFEAAR